VPYEVIASERALADWRGILDYLTEKYPDSVEEIHQGMIDWLGGLSSNPHIGDVLKRRAAGVLREAHYRTYRINFQVDDETNRVVVARIRHVARNRPRSME